MDIRALQESITQRIINDLEAGTPTWCKPWKSGATSIRPRNHVTSAYYSGANILILFDAQQRHGYARSEWASFLQFKEKGGIVRKGEKATNIVFTKKLTVEDKDAPDGERQFQMLRTWSVFNISQVDGLPASEPTLPVEEKVPSMAQVAAFIAAIGADVRYGGNGAFYSPSLDYIAMPPLKAFDTEEHFWNVMLHEHVHLTGHQSRLARDFSGRFASAAYAMEELVAEIGAAFLCAELGIEAQLNHAGYVSHWLEILKGDNRAIFAASAKAQQAVDYLRSFSSEAQEAA